MSEFKIDFFELCFLAEACMPPRPIARMNFWENLTNIYWAKMTENERTRLFNFLNRNSFYETSLKEEPETKVFHARFDPKNQYLVSTNYKDKDEQHRAFKMNDKYYVASTTWIDEKYITKVEEYIDPKK